MKGRRNLVVERDGVLAPIGAAADDRPIGIAWRGNPLEGTWSPPIGPGELVLAWSGTLASGLFEPHPTTWLRPGHESLGRLCDRLATVLAEQGRRLCFHPHARHVLSDVQSSFSFHRERGEQPFGVALAPTSLLEPAMLDELEDHLRRAFETLGPIATLVVLEDAVVADDAVAAAPLGRGGLPRDLVLELLASHVPEATPLVLRDDELDRQLGWLGSSGGSLG